MEDRKYPVRSRTPIVYLHLCFYACDGHTRVLMLSSVFGDHYVLGDYQNMKEWDKHRARALKYICGPGLGKAFSVKTLADMTSHHLYIVDKTP